MEMNPTSEKSYEKTYVHEDAWAAALDASIDLPERAHLDLDPGLPQTPDSLPNAIPDIPAFDFEIPMTPAPSDSAQKSELPEVPALEMPTFELPNHEFSETHAEESDGVLEMTISPRVPDNPLFAPTDGSAEIEIEDQAFLEDLKRIPDKMAFKIGEAADIIGVKQYVLRYWETEFDVLKPKKSAHNQRMFTRRDVETGMLIKKLLYKDRFSIEGARKALKNLRKKVKEEKQKETAFSFVDDAIDQLHDIREDLGRMKRLFA